MLYIKISSKINKCNVFTIVRMSRGSGHFIYNTVTEPSLKRRNWTAQAQAQAQAS